MARDQALRQIWDQAANLAVQTSEKTLRRKLSPDDHRRLIDEAIIDLRRATEDRQKTLAGSNGMSEPAKALEHVEADVSAQRVARVYAESLLNIGWKLMCGQEMLDDLDAIVNTVFPTDPRLEEFLSSRIVEHRAQGRVHPKGFRRPGSLDSLWISCRYSIATAGSICSERSWPSIARLFDQRLNHVRVLVTSAVPLDDDLKGKLLASLSEGMHRTPILETKVDPDIIGGLIVRIDDYQYDASVSTRLDALRDQLIERGSHEIQSGRDRFCSTEGN